MGLLTGIGLTMYVVYVYCSFASRMVDIKKEFEKEEKVDVHSALHA